LSPRDHGAMVDIPEALTEIFVEVA